MLLRCNSLPSWFVGLLLLLLLLGSKAHTSGKKELSCQKNKPNDRSPRIIGVVLESGSEIGKQQMVAVKMALRRFHWSSCVKFEILPLDSHPSFTSPSSSAVDLITNEGLKAIVGEASVQDYLIVIFDNKIPLGIPLISTSAEQLQQLKSPSLIHMANNITHPIKCIASFLTHFQLPPKVTIFYELTTMDHPFVNSSFSVHRLFDSFRSVNVEIEHLLALSSSSNQAVEISIEKELKKLMNSQSNGVFIVTQLSVELVDLLLTKARKLNMVGNGYVWIVSNDVFDLMDSLNSSSSSSSSSLWNDMEGVIGFRTYFDDTKKFFKSFETNFKKMYSLEYPKDEEPRKASIFAVRAYDASWAITRAISMLDDEKFSSSQLIEKISKSNFEGLSGMVRFKNGMLTSESPNFQIIEVVDQSYKEVAFWTLKSGFSESFVKKNEKAAFRSNNMGNMVAIRHLSESFSKEDGRGQKRLLKFVVPGQGACREFVNVSKYLNGTTKNITGFSIDVFKAVMKNINMPHYELHSFDKSYNEMIDEVYNKNYDGAVGDITILAKRFKQVDFTVAYLKTGIVMVVTEKEDMWKKLWAFMNAFDLEVWLLIPTMHIFISTTIWLIERQNNQDLKGFGNMLWFSVSMIFYMHREPVKNGGARLVLGPWLFAILVVTTSFSSSLTSKTMISWSQPSVLDVEMLKITNATVGCNAESFIYGYLQNTLKFEPGNIRKMSSIDDYPEALKNGSIKAAFLISPHAEVFLAKNCGGFTKAGSSFKLGGFGFAFPKGSPLAAKVSKSIAELTLNNNISSMEETMLGSFKCSPTEKGNGLALGPGPFAGLFFICGGNALLVLLYMRLPFITTKLGKLWPLLPIHFRH